MTDDELRDAFGNELTAALALRSRDDDPAETVVAPPLHAHRQWARRQLLVAAAVIAILAGGAAALVSHNSRGDRVRTITPSDTRVASAPHTTPTTAPRFTSSSGAPSTTTTIATPPANPVRTVTPTGVGTLRFGVATEAAVRAEIGAPDAIVRGSFGLSSDPDYRAMGYECSNTKGSGLMHIGPYGPDTPPYCRTVFYLNVNTSTLAGFATTTGHYATAHGTKVGMTGVEAAARESRPVVSGCFSGIALGPQSTTPRMFVFVAVYSNSRVNGISVDNPGNTVGVLFC